MQCCQIKLLNIAKMKFNRKRPKCKTSGSYETAKCVIYNSTMWDYNLDMKQQNVFDLINSEMDQVRSIVSYIMDIHD